MTSSSTQRKALLLFLAFLSSNIQISSSFSTPSNNNNSNSNNSNNSNNFNLDNLNNNPNLNNNKYLTSSQRIRREEEQRRLDRTNENIPGKTSAIPGQKDLPLDIERTTREYYASPLTTSTEKRVKDLTDDGMNFLRGLQLENAKEAFDEVYRIKPYAYCWQKGVVEFYLGRYYDAAECFAHNANLYESKFGIVASEERIWRDACQLKIENTVGRQQKLEEQRRIRKRKKEGGGSDGVDDAVAEAAVVAQIRNKNEDSILGPRETRKVIRIARDLFSSSIDHDLSNEALARAKLRSICGEYDNTNSNSSSSSTSSSSSPFRADKKMWRLNSWYYLGLHYDVLDDDVASRDCMKMALRQCASAGHADDIVQTLPLLHMAKREWFDDDEFAEDTGDDFDDYDDFNDTHFRMGGTELSTTSASTIINSNTNNFGNGDSLLITTRNDNNLFESIQDSVDKMKLVELQSALKKKGLKSSGSKSILKDRLLRSLIDEAGFS